MYFLLASCTMATGSSPGVNYGPGLLLTPHPLLVPWSWKGRAIPLPTLWATTWPVTGTLYLFFMYCLCVNVYCTTATGCQPNRSWQLYHVSITVPSFAEEMPQNVPVQRLKGGNPTTGLPSNRLVTHSRDLSVPFKLQFKDNRTANLTNYFKKTVKQNFFNVRPKFLSWKVYGHVL